MRNNLFFWLVDVVSNFWKLLIHELRACFAKWTIALLNISKSSCFPDGIYFFYTGFVRNLATSLIRVEPLMSQGWMMQNVCWKHRANNWAKTFFFFPFLFHFILHSFSQLTHSHTKLLSFTPNPTLTSDDSRNFLQRTGSRPAVPPWRRRGLANSARASSRTTGGTCGLLERYQDYLWWRQLSERQARQQSTLRDWREQWGVRRTMSFSTCLLTLLSMLSRLTFPCTFFGIRRSPLQVKYSHYP